MQPISARRLSAGAGTRRFCEADASVGVGSTGQSRQRVTLGSTRGCQGPASRAGLETSQLRAEGTRKRGVLGLGSTGRTEKGTALSA